MNNYYTLIYLIREWKERLIDATFDVALSTRKNLLELFFDSRGIAIRLIFSSNPQNAALFIDRYQKPLRQNTVSFFEDLQGDTLIDIKLADSDRFIQFYFHSGRQIVFLLYSNNANALLIDNGIVLESFKKNKVMSGLPSPEPVPVSVRQDRHILKISDLVSNVDPLLPRDMVRVLLKDLDIQNNTALAIDKVQSLRNSLMDQAFPHYSAEYGFSIVNPSLLGTQEIKRFDNLNEGIAYSFFKWIKYQDFETRKKSVLDRIQKSMSRIHVAISELSSGTDVNEKAELFERYGHILMANPNSVPKSGVVEVEDFYNDGKRIEIKIDPQKSLVDNAQLYYQKARSIRRNSETYARRMTDFQQKSEQLRHIYMELNGIQFGREFEKWMKSNENVLKRIGYSEADTIQNAQHYRSYFRGNLEIRVGKSATSNDELLRLSKKDDIWMHARGVPGSHVTIPLNKNQQLPSPDVMEYAAGLAAFFSKAKGSSLVPVIFTRRKYVRKSKGMAPGSVIVDKEEVLLVPPIKPDELHAEE